MKKFSLIILFVMLSACSRAPLKNREDLMRPASDAPALMDNLSKESFFIALRNHIDVMKKSNQVKDPMVFGKKQIPKADYIGSLEKIFEHESDWLDYITLNFEAYEVYGRDDWADVMVTGYYEPKVPGSKTKTKEFFQPAYATPSDMLVIDLKKFASKFPKGEKLGTLTARLENKRVVPYYDRKDIDENNKLANQKLELVWLDPIDAFFIQIQGTGVVEFEDGEKLRIGYDGQNGHAYFPIGKFLTDHIPMEEMSMQRIRSHLKTLPFKEQQTILNKNPSYVFFKKLDGKALTYAGMEVEDGRTIATDLQLFPKGALAFLDIEEPVFDSETATVATMWERKPRLVFDQDTGGAIKGSGRVDLFYGEGDPAAQKAGVMKQKGKLFYLVPR
jgi:membrane-bound lytic murein transglycosylase A